MTFCSLLVATCYLLLLGDKSRGFYLGDEVGVQEVFVMELAPFPSVCRGNSPNPLDTGCLALACWVLPFPLSPPAVLASGGGAERVWWLAVQGDEKGGLLTRDAGDFAHAVVVEKKRAERGAGIME